MEPILLYSYSSNPSEKWSMSLFESLVHTFGTVGTVDFLLKC